VNDNQFATTMMTILGVLIALTVLIMVIANILMPGSNYSQDKLVQGSIEDRIKPVGTVAIAGVTPVNANEGGGAAGETTVATNDATVNKTAEELYTACAACHNSGVLNAPKLGDKASWAPHVAKGKDTLYHNAINGLNAMPAKGGRADYSDDDIMKVVDYMLESVQ
jgi:cytochrome c5